VNGLVLASIVAGAFCVRFETCKAADSADPLSQFENRVTSIKGFLASPKRMVLEYTSSGSPLYFATELVAGPVSYDVRKTDSLVSPFSAYVAVNAVASQNAQCGSVQAYGRGIGWPTQAEAIASMGLEGCFRPMPPAEMRFNYAFQQGRWVLKSIVSSRLGQSPKDEPYLSSALGIAVDSFVPVASGPAYDFNAQWRATFLP
jgi:hypothetical protein